VANDRSGWLGRSHDERDRHRGRLATGPRAYFSTKEDLLSAAFDHI
jgi:hypothetical protein